MQAVGWTRPPQAGETWSVTTIEPTQTATAPESADAATKAFSTSVMISAVRCLLTYIVFPWLLPLFGLAKDVGPGIGLGVGAIAVFFNVASIRRFHRSNHAWKWWITGLNVAVIIMLVVLASQDFSELLG